MASLQTKQEEISSRAFGIISKALDHDQNDDLKGALQLYRQGAELLTEALNFTDMSSSKSRGLAQRIQTNLAKVLDRTTEIESSSSLTSSAPPTFSTHQKQQEQEQQTSFLNSFVNRMIGISTPPNSTTAPTHSVAIPPPQVVQKPTQKRNSRKLNNNSNGASAAEVQKPTRERSRSAEARAALSKSQQQQQGVPSQQQRRSKSPGPEKSAEQKKKEREELLRGIDKNLQQTILNDVVEHGQVVTWDDIGGLEDVKRALYESVILPNLRPDLFRGLRAPPRGLLLFGPPGNGKTMIAKAVAHESKATFFNVSAGSLTSKWVGEGEKLVRALFALARYLQPTVIFIDEVDSILTQRSENEHDAMRRLKTEFLIQFDGMNSSSEERLFVMGATNRPQDLDEAARRRFPKRIYVRLPDSNTRQTIISKLLKQHSHTINKTQLENVANKSDGYSAADLTALCKEAAMAPLRDLGPGGVVSVDILDVRPICVDDFLHALRVIRPSVSQESLTYFAKWNSDYGCIA